MIVLLIELFSFCTFHKLYSLIQGRLVNQMLHYKKEKIRSIFLSVQNQYYDLMNLMSQFFHCEIDIFATLKNNKMK